MMHPDEADDVGRNPASLTLAELKEWIDRHLDRQAMLPCKVEEMTPREHRIHKEHVAYHTGFLLYLQQRLALAVGDPAPRDGLITVGRPLPRIEDVRPLAGLVIEVTWDGGRTETVDLSPVIRDFRYFSSLREDRELFETVSVAEWGGGIEWGDVLIAMAASTVERLAEAHAAAG